jgi:hypothetical protein
MANCWAKLPKLSKKERTSGTTEEVKVKWRRGLEEKWAWMLALQPEFSFATCSCSKGTWTKWAFSQKKSKEVKRCS